MKRIFLSYVFIIGFVTLTCTAIAQRPVWNKEKANAWYAKLPWMAGADFLPSTAINQLEMWQKESFDTATINRELGYAEGIGMNLMRVYLHHLAWQIDKNGFKNRMNTYLAISDKHGIKTIFVFFDDCWNAHYKPGTQPAPKPGVHNSGWVRDPGRLRDMHLTADEMLEVYVKDILKTFKKDKRILLWDVYNEPGNSDYGNKSMPLLQKVFTWGRMVNPDQPLSAGVWNLELKDLNKFQLANSDVITYHNYLKPEEHLKWIDSFLVQTGKPLLCTEYMARTRGSRFENIMPLLKERKIAAVNWGLVAGKSNTIYAWDSPMPDGSEPMLWFHDVFRKDGTPYNENEVQLIKSLTGKK